MSEIKVGQRYKGEGSPVEVTRYAGTFVNYKYITDKEDIEFGERDHVFLNRFKPLDDFRLDFNKALNQLQSTLKEHGFGRVMGLELDHKDEVIQALLAGEYFVPLPGSQASDIFSYYGVRLK